MTDLVARLTAALDETEAWARAASQTQQSGTPTGEHWQWECSHCDTPITINPVTDEYVNCPHGCSASVSLRGVEQYPASEYYTLPAFVVTSEEVPATAGALIARHDPASVLRMVAALREILAEHRPYGGSYEPEARSCAGCGLTPEEEPRTPDINRCPTLLALAAGLGVEVEDVRD